MAARENWRVTSGTDDGQRPCAQKEWCSAATRAEDGTWQPALTYQPFCPADRSRIASRLEELPAACERLAVAVTAPPARTGRAVRVPPGPRVPLRPDAEALLRFTASALGSWHERVAAIAGLTPPDTQLDGKAGSDLVAIAADAESALSTRLDALLALAREEAARIMEPHAVPDWAAALGLPAEPEGTVLRSGLALLMPRLSGVHAGREILDLHYRARKLLGETRPPREILDGIPCRECEEMALERAEPPSDPSLPAMHSRCAVCKDEMDRDEFGKWARQYAAWAQGAGVLECRRCSLGLHHECFWTTCGCASAGHAAA